MKYVDFHVHMDFYNKPEEIINIYERMQIYSLFVTNLPEIYEKHLRKYNKYKYIKLALGYHPEMLDFYQFNNSIFDKYLSTTNYIGEVGIDGSKKYAHNIKMQTETFNCICNKIKDLPKILTVHSKNAETLVFDILKDNKIKFAVFHWYSGNIKTLRDIIEHGYYFSINPCMLQSQKGKEILNNIPLNRILFESDGPFTKFNKVITKPQYFESIYEQFNEFYSISSFKELVFTNFKNLLVERQLLEQEDKILKMASDKLI